MLPGGQNETLGQFLRYRRAAVRPADVGLADESGGRRVTGLRRQEVADLVGVSVDHYARLEQGRERRPSPSVVTALGRVLLQPGDDAGLQYLWRVADPDRITRRPRPSDGRTPVSPVLTDLMSSWPSPALVIDRQGSLLAVNRAGKELAPVPQGASLARFVFADAAAHRWFGDWSTTARRTAAALRAVMGAAPEDRRTSALVGELSDGSADFRRIWAKGEVAHWARDTVEVRHPRFGLLDLRVQASALNGTPGHQLVLIAPTRAGTPTDRAESPNWNLSPRGDRRTCDSPPACRS